VDNIKMKVREIDSEDETFLGISTRTCPMAGSGISNDKLGSFNTVLVHRLSTLNVSRYK
jgi:hypothetical protein